MGILLFNVLEFWWHVCIDYISELWCLRIWPVWCPLLDVASVVPIAIAITSVIPIAIAFASVVPIAITGCGQCGAHCHYLMWPVWCPLPFTGCGQCGAH